MISWAFINANFLGHSKQDCLPKEGACWVFIKVRLSVFLYGFYPAEQRWRVDMALLVMLFSTLPILLNFIRNELNLLRCVIICTILATGIFVAINQQIIASMGIIAILFWPVIVWGIWPKKSLLYYLVVHFFFLALPVIAILFTGSETLGLTPVSTDQWGGFFLTIVVASVGIMGALPLGVLLALGRQSDLPVISVICVIFIEFLRGIPLLSVLFMASTMLPLFLPEGVSVNKLLRALIAVAIFYSVYMAEVIRGGLQAIGKGQYEGADAIALSYWQKMRLVILPQALRLVIPGLVNNVLGLFKDTTLVAAIGLLDLLGTIKTALADTQWLGFSKEAYFFAALVFWVFCYLISQYGKQLEKKLHDQQNRP
ncbi:MAG: amino acid ABC transporter permease [Ostreibacterium sp.]